MRVVVIGGGPAGFSAAVVAKQVGADVVLLERANRLGGLGYEAGIYLLHAAKIPLAEDRQLGGGDLFDILESIALRRDVAVPGWTTISTYNVTLLDAAMQKALRERGVDFRLRKRATDVEMSGDVVTAVRLSGGERVEGDVFVDATGAFRGTADCRKYGYGCVGCSVQCSVFGVPGDIIGKKVGSVAIQTEAARKIGQWGQVGTSIQLALGSLSKPVQDELEAKGWIQVPVPLDVEPNLERATRAGQLEGGHYGGYDDKGPLWQLLTVVNVGKLAKLTTAASGLWSRSLRKVPGFENAIVVDPVAGESGHSMHQTAIALRDNALRADHFGNLFCAGNKGGGAESLLDAMITGELAGYNAVRRGLGMRCLELPKTLVIGAFINYMGQMMRSEEGRNHAYTLLSGELLKELNVYREESEIARMVEEADLTGIYKRKLT